MKKSKARTQTNKPRARQNNRKGSKTKVVSKSKSAAEATLIPTDIRRAYKSRLIDAYFKRPH